MMNDSENEIFELNLEKLSDIIDSYNDNKECYIALSLAFNFYIFDHGCRSFEDYVANKITPLSEGAKKILRDYIHFDGEDTQEFLFEVDKVFGVLGGITKTASPDCKLLLEEAIAIFKEFSKDGRFVRSCNKCFLEVKKEVEGDFDGFGICED